MSQKAKFNRAAKKTYDLLLEHYPSLNKAKKEAKKYALRQSIPDSILKKKYKEDWAVAEGLEPTMFEAVKAKEREEKSRSPGEVATLKQRLVRDEATRRVLLKWVLCMKKNGGEVHGDLTQSHFSAAGGRNWRPASFKDTDGLVLCNKDGGMFTTPMPPKCIFSYADGDEQKAMSVHAKNVRYEPAREEDGDAGSHAAKRNASSMEEARQTEKPAPPAEPSAKRRRRNGGAEVVAEAPASEDDPTQEMSSGSGAGGREEEKHHYIFIVGNNDYANDYSRLQGAVNDATNVKDYFEGRGFVAVCHFNVPCNSTFKEFLVTFIDTHHITHRDLLLIYFAGHGSYMAGHGEHALQMTGKSAPGPDDKSKVYVQTHILRELLRGSRCTVGVILDCCRTVEQRGRRDLPQVTESGPAVARQPLPGGSFLLHSCEHRKEAREGTEGVFTSTFLDVLGELDRERCMDLSAVHRAVNGKLKSSSGGVHAQRSVLESALITSPDQLGRPFCLHHRC